MKIKISKTKKKKKNWTTILLKTVDAEGNSQTVNRSRPGIDNQQ